MTQRRSARDRMIISAMQLFRERGVAATALSDVVEHSGAPRGSLYHYFPHGKAQLATEATAKAGRLMGGMISSLVAAKGPVEAVAGFVEFSRQNLVTSDFASGCPVAAGALEGGDAPGAREVAGEAFTSWEAALSAALWQHGVPARRADLLATLIISAVEGAIVLAKAQRSTRPLDRIGEELTTHVRGVLNPS